MQPHKQCVLLAAILVAAFITVADDKMHILASVTPMHAALAIIAIGMAGFVLKLLFWWQKQAQKVSSGHEQAAPQEACSEENDQTSSR